MDFSSHIFCRKDVGALFLPGLPVRSIVLVVDGPTAVEPFPMILPTDAPGSTTAAMIAGWLTAHNSPCIEACAMTPSQRETLLTIVCGYRAFLELPPGVREGDFYTLAHKLIDAAFELGVLEPADKKLRDIADWLEAILPVTCFLPVLDDAYEARDPEDQTEDDMTGLMAAFASMLDPRLHQAMQGTDLGAVLSTASTSQSSTPSCNKARNLRKKARKAACKAARSLNPLTQAGTLAQQGSNAASEAAGIDSTSAHADSPSPRVDSAAAAARAVSVAFVPTSEAAPLAFALTAVESGMSLLASGDGIFNTPSLSQHMPTSEDWRAAVHDEPPCQSWDFELATSITRRAVTVEEVPDVDGSVHRMPVLDAKGKGTAKSVPEEISDEDSDDSIPGLVDIVNSSDSGEDNGAYALEVLKVMRAAPFIFKQY